ncbi:MAG: AAA family ATPase, partial [Bacteroidales bacterium]|nr:AAA family ATPase [Bacteroidales bacterium]
MQILRNLKDQNIIKVITGVRRCGKSTLLQMFADELLNKGILPKQIQFYNFEDPDIYTIGDWKDIYDHIKVRLLPHKMNYVFLDEIQNIAVFQRLVDGLFIKKNVDLYVTGSNDYLLSGELATLLTGRYIETNILPLQFDEYYHFITLKSPNLPKKESLAISDDYKTDYKHNIRLKPPNLPKKESLAVSDDHHADYKQNIRLKSPNLPKKESLAVSRSYNIDYKQNTNSNLSKIEILANFLQEGGIPEYHKQKNISQKQADDFVQSVLNTIIEKDIFQRLSIRDKHDFNKIIDFVF